MDNTEKLNIIEHMQEVCAQMRIDDIEENPDSGIKCFDCGCCGKSKPYAGSIEYVNGTRLCNDCVLLAETGFALNKFSNVHELIEAMEDTRLEEICNYIKSEQARESN